MNTAELPKISVIIPVHNAGRTLKRCLESLEKQSDPNYEVIVVDDGSTDDSRRIAEDICNRSGFRLLSLANNKGQAVARNEGAREATGTILAFVDSDVSVPRDWLEKYRRLLEDHPEADVICSGYTVSTGDPAPALFASHEAYFRRQNLPSLRLQTTTSANCVMAREAFEEVGGFPEYYVHSRRDRDSQKAVSVNEDSELGFLISRKGRAILWSHDNLVRHYFRDTWRAYLRQQVASARYGFLSVFQFPGMLFAKDLYSGEKIIPQLVVMSLMLLALPGIFLGWKGLVVAGLTQAVGLVFFALYHWKFLRYLKNNMDGYRFHRQFFWLIVARLVWIWGVLLGLRDGCLLLWNAKVMRPGTP